MNTIFAPIVKRFSGFADLSDRYRPPPTPALAEVLSAGATVMRLMNAV